MSRKTRDVTHPAEIAKLLKSDLLKVGHHGSATSSTWEFIRAVQPRWAIISVDEEIALGIRNWRRCSDSSRKEPRPIAPISPAP